MLNTFAATRFGDVTRDGVRRVVESVVLGYGKGVEEAGVVAGAA
jgi:hypothetical protein